MYSDALRPLVGPDVAATRLDKSARDQRAEARAVRLRHMERFENGAKLFAWNTAAGIRDRHLDQRGGDGSGASMRLGLAENRRNVPIAGNGHLRLPELE